MIPEGYEICDWNDAENILYRGHVCEFIRHTERGHGDLSHLYIVSLPDCKMGQFYDYEIYRMPAMMPICKIKEPAPEPKPDGDGYSIEATIASAMVYGFLKNFGKPEGKK